MPSTVDTSVRSIPWKRFWANSATPDLDEGYLANPEDELRFFVGNEHARTLEQLAGFRCLILLGEPGSGKSSEVDRASNKARKVDLSLVSDVTSLYRHLFDASWLSEWREGQDELTLYLESLDECLLRVSRVVDLLGREMASWPLDRLRLRIVCRSAEWPVSFEEQLRARWTKEPLRVFHLLPLRRVDVAQAAVARGLEPDWFLSQVQQMGAIPLAARPVTLNFLLKFAARDGVLPSTQREIYEAGCRLLCEENRSRHVERELLTTDSVRRYELATRIAASLQFCGRFAVFTGDRSGEAPPGTLTVADLCAEAGFSEREFRETLDTGLFAGRGEQLVAFAHQSYAEYLASEYVIGSPLPPSGRMRLLTHGGRLIPQLAETAAWMAGADRTVREFILDDDPDTLLRSDIVRQDVELKKALIDKFLADPAEAEEKAYGFGLPMLDHLGLSTQLRPYLIDRQKHTASRLLAAGLADFCQCAELLPELVSVATDINEDHWLRWRCACCIKDFGDASARLSLKPLAEGAAGKDERDMLKSTALEILWPDHLTAEEFFRLLPSPTSPHFERRYQWVCSSAHSLARLSAADLPFALDWLRGAADHRDDLDDIGEAAREIVRLSLENIRTPPVLECLADLVLACVRNHNNFFEPLREGRGVLGKEPAPLEMPADTRRRLTAAVIERATADDTAWNLTILLEGKNPLLTTDDAQWALDQLEAAVYDYQRKMWMEIACELLVYGWHSDLALVFSACAKHPELRTHFGWALDAVELGSEREKMMRNRHEPRSMRRSQPTMEQPASLPHQEISKHLNAFESGDTTSFLHLSDALALSDDGRTRQPASVFDITPLAGWHGADSETKHRILTVAGSYLKQCVPIYEDYSRRNDDDYINSGYRALHLLKKEAPEVFAALPEEVWQRWTPTTLLVWPDSRDGMWERHISMLRSAYDAAPDEFQETIRHRIIAAEQEGTKGGNGRIDLWELRGFWDLPLLKIVCERAESLPWPNVQTLASLLDILSSQGPGIEGAVELLKRGVEAATSFYEGTTDFDEQLGLALLLCQSGYPGSWQPVWATIRSDDNFGKLLLESLSYVDRHGEHRRCLTGLAEGELADLFEWLEERYPSAEDPRPEGIFSPTTRYEIGSFRSHVITHLVNRKTSACCAALCRLESRFPEYIWLTRSRRRAEELCRREEWEPFDTADLFAFLRGDQYLIQDADDLARCVLTSLGKLQTRLQGETPMAFALWDEVASGEFKPKGEEALSDLVKDHLTIDLEKRGVIAAREVQIRRGQGNAQGERTDIHVTAVLNGSSDIARVIIETKPCWNSQWRTGIEKQLVGRYLRDNDCHHGIFLGGWFEGRQSPVSTTVEEFRQELQNQAAQYVGSGNVVAAFVLDASLRPG